MTNYLGVVEFPDKFTPHGGVNISPVAYTSEGFWLIPVYGRFGDKDNPYYEYVFRWDGPGKQAYLYPIQKYTNLRGALVEGGDYIWLFSWNEEKDKSTKLYYQNVAKRPTGVL